MKSLTFFWKLMLLYCFWICLQSWTWIVGNSLKSSHPSLNSLSNCSLTQLHEVNRKVLSLFNTLERDFTHCFFSMALSGLRLWHQTPFVNTNMKSIQLVGRFRMSSTFNLVLDKPPFSIITPKSCIAEGEQSIPLILEKPHPVSLTWKISF